MEDLNPDDLSIDELAADLEEWRLAYLDIVHPHKYRQKLAYFNRRVAQEKNQINSENVK